MSDENLNQNKNLLGGGWRVYKKYVRIKAVSSQMYTIAYKEGGGLILAGFVRTY